MMDGGILSETGLTAAALDEAIAVVGPIVVARLDPQVARRMPRGHIARDIEAIVTEVAMRGRVQIGEDIRRDLITHLIESVVGDREEEPVAEETEQISTDDDDIFEPNITLADLTAPAIAQPPGKNDSRSATIEAAKRDIQPFLMEEIDVTKASELPRDELAKQISAIVSDIASERKIRLNLSEQRDLVTMLLNDMLGLGPLEPLLADDAITDILVNGPKQVYVERKGKLELTDVVFKDNQHVQNIATRIVTRIGRRIDESSPLCDARLEDGSRVNIIIPPLAIDGPSISIRKFSKKSITLDVMASQKNISVAMATVLKVASRSRLNILISGGTGSGKTTLLNALSQLIDLGERIVTIEDAAELQLQQPHVVRLETRPANLEGEGEITMRELVKNSLRMRPDRIILGEVRGSEAVDMLQAMNTGHEGSMCTVHANRPREALTRLENMVGMAGINLPSKAVRTQIADALDVIVQISRMRDGVRRVTSVTEVVGMEGEVITTQELFRYDFEGEDANGMLLGSFVPGGLRPHFTPKAEYFNLDRPLLEAIG
ncbi:MAG: pilus assembly protein CpaF [Paracoccaceae bacterium]|jgi:pilus assembly protein CpaF